MLANFKWPEPKEQVDDKVIRDVIEYKCHIIGIPQDEQGPGYSFSIGLYLHFNHPEIVIFGLDHEIAAAAINEICVLVEKGHRFQNKETTNELFNDIGAMLIDVNPKFYKEYFGTALWFYRSIGDKFPVLQIVWPDKLGRFPWDSSFDEKSKHLQPILAENFNAKL